MAEENSSNKERHDAKLSRKDGLFPKSFHDPVHGHIELNPFLVKVIDTPQFQRLRKIKQLSLCYYVYPGACHNRFEHCIGTCHLAGRLVRHLANNLPEGHSEITKKEIFCVELAGLCHDLGHGPFSHLFDENIPKKYDPDKKWKHEQGSVDMLQRLFDQNKLKETFNENEAFKKEFGQFENEDLKFVKEMILDPNPKCAKDNEKKYTKGKEKRFLYEIVSNEKSGVDVDKWDYFARDCHHLGIKSSFDHNRYLALTKVLKKENGETCIAVRDKECINLYEMFHTRNALHKRAYKHKTAVAIGAMVSDVLVLADEFIKYKGDETEKAIFETIQDMSAFQKLDDNVLDLIMRAEDKSEELKKAKNLLNRLSERKIYRFIDRYSIPGTKQNESDAEKENKKIEGQADKAKEELENLAKEKNLNNDLFVKKLKFDYGKKNSNPVDFSFFYSKEDPTKIKKISREEVSHMLPDIFLEYQLFVYCKSEEDEIVRNVRKCYDEWKKTKEGGTEIP